MKRPRRANRPFSSTMSNLRGRAGRAVKNRRPINVLASVMTTMNLYCGVSSIFAVIGGDFEKGALFILGGMIFDMLDGFVARLTHSSSEFGKELDSLCDVVTFGIAPAVLVFVVYLHELHEASPLNDILSARTESVLGKTGSYMGIIYAICAALRLARFNTFQSDRRDSFVGLPSPAAGGTIAAFILFLEYFAPRLEVHQYGPLAYYLLGPLSVLLALLMVSTVLYPKGRLKQFVLKPRHAFMALGVYAFVIAIVHYAVAKSPYIVLFPVAMTYVLFGMGDTLYQWSQRTSVSKGEAPVSSSGDASSGGDTSASESSGPKNAEVL